MTPRFGRSASLHALAVAVVLATGCVPDEPTRGRDSSAAQIHDIRVAEDRRAPDETSLQVLTAGLASPDMDVRRVSVRALGRLERPELLDALAPMLSDPEPPVRAEAANALAQAVRLAPGDAALRMLTGRLPRETDPAVLGALARSVARLSLTDSAAGATVEDALLFLSRDANGVGRTPETMIGVALGMESWARRLPANATVGDTLIVRLREMTTFGRLPPVAGASRVRSLAVTALAEVGAMSVQDVRTALDDHHTRVRRAALTGLGGLPPAQWMEPIRRGLLDPSVNVRVQAVRDLGGLPRGDLECMRLLAAATKDLSTLVRTVAIDLLAEPCPVESGVVDTLTLIADSGDPDDALHWHAPAHALVALAALDPQRARARVPVLATHASPFARAYAARAAGRVGYTEALRTLAADPDANVRTAATEELFRLTGHDADSILLGQLESDDPQLLLTAAKLLEGTPWGAGVAGPVLDAFERISAAGPCRNNCVAPKASMRVRGKERRRVVAGPTARRSDARSRDAATSECSRYSCTGPKKIQTLRDPRRALLARIAELGSADLAPRLRPYLSDYDPRVAGDVASILERWTGRRPRVDPHPPAPVPVPGRAALRRLQHTRVLLHMRRGGTITIGLFPEPAPTNAARFVRLAREGFFDGRTFHRVVADFVIQGGSPGANEYRGDDRYTRDEVELLPHWRGTVGVSTRGRDTGDGQIFINLIDNVRLDHDYTVFGVVELGMETVAAVLEGDVIERAEVRTGA